VSPAAIPIDVTFQIWSALDTPVFDDQLTIDGAPPWLSVRAYTRAASPDRFVTPAWLAELDDELSQAEVIYEVQVAPGDRPENDIHLQIAIQIGAQLAEASSGLVVDEQARRVLDAEEFAASCEPEVEHHVTYAFVPPHLRTFGMGKLGLAEVAMLFEGADDLDEEIGVAGTTVLDAIASAMAAGAWHPGQRIELAGTTWELGSDPELLLAGPVGRDLAELLAELAEQA